jgi:hypothetical protein
VPLLLSDGEGEGGVEIENSRVLQSTAVYVEEIVHEGAPDGVDGTPDALYRARPAISDTKLADFA